ncbi:fumarate and nitrate reduction regulatory protein [Aurantiacibacter atlanticus]|uniref:Fumarate and nitrate reduction regulatory protein n=1 Tax=Aurantiacibacter atlanticus TaxID=1648404 RepID=A0A161IUE3_9SPHN|nr:fumarate and nitrate reduction regulatory protein [Aurantiacibacter atlanticus]
MPCGAPNAVKLSDETKGRLRIFGQPVDMAAGDSMELNGACFVMSGSVKLWRTLPNGLEHITAFSYAGSLIFGQTKETEPLRITALEKSLVIPVPASAFPAMHRDNAIWGDDFLNAATLQIASLQMHAAMLARMSACERVAAFLVSMAETGGRDKDNPSRVHLPMSRAEIGDHLGLTIETVSRCMTRLRNEKLLTCPARHEVLILDADGLENFHERT